VSKKGTSGAFSNLSVPKLQLGDLWNILNRFNEALFPSWLIYLKQNLRGCKSVLDLGCGANSPIKHCSVPFSVGVELFDAYLEESRRKGIHNEYLKGNITEIDFPAKSFDAVLCLEVLEHLTKAQGYELITKMETWARKKVIITTPNGLVWQDSLDGNPLQEHKSGWSAYELQQLGFEVHGIRGWKKLRGYRGKIRYRPLFFWAKLSHISQWVTYYYPSFAFQLFAVKQFDE